MSNVNDNPERDELGFGKAVEDAVGLGKSASDILNEVGDIIGDVYKDIDVDDYVRSLRGCGDDC